MARKKRNEFRKTLAETAFGTGIRIGRVTGIATVGTERFVFRVKKKKQR